MLVLSGLLACACGSGGKAGPSDGGAGSDGAVAGTKFGAVLVLAPGPGAYFASAAFSDSPRLVPAGEFTSVEFGIGDTNGCTTKTVDGCRVFRCSMPIAAKPHQATDPDVGALTIGWVPTSAPAGGNGLPPQITFPPDSYDLFFWGTASAVARFTFSAAGGTIPAFPATDVDVPQPFEVTRLDGDDPAIDPRISRGEELPVTWTGGTADAVLVLEQGPLGTNDDLMAVCRIAASAGSFTFSSSVLGEFQPGDVQLRSAAVSTKLVAAGEHATTLAIAVPGTFRFLVKIE